MKTSPPLLNVKFMFICSVILLGGIIPAKAQLNMLFTNDLSVSGWQSSDIYLTILRGQYATNPLNSDYLPDITFVNNPGVQAFTWTAVTNVVYSEFNTSGVPSNTAITIGQGYSDSLTLSNVMSQGGLRWISNAPSAQVIISYGAPIPSTSVTYQTIGITGYTNQIAFYANGQLAANSTNDPSYQIPYQNFELTYSGTNTGDQGDITAINYIGSLLKISSYASSDATGSALQTVGYAQSNTSQMASLLQTFTNTIGSSGYGNTTLSSIVTNSSGGIVRVIGPSQFVGGVGTGIATYTNFNDYLGSVQASVYSNTVLSNYSGYNTVVGGATTVNGNQTNVLVTFVMTNTVTGTGGNNGYGLSATGSITLVYTSYFNGAPTGTNTNTISGIQFQVPGLYTNSTNGVYPTAAAQFIYGASSGANNYFVQNAAYSTLQSYLAQYVDGANSNAMVDVTSQIQGELAEAFSFGLAGSTNLATNGDVIGHMPSGMWWQQSNGVTPFAGAQTNPAFYNIYAALIAQASSNQVYGAPYSDRFAGSNSPLINDLQYVQNGVTNPVNSWLINVGAPVVGADIGSVPEPSTPFLLGLGSLAGVVALLRSRRKS